MLRSRGNRLPSERAARSPLLSFPSITFAAAPAGSLSLSLSLSLLYHSGHAVPVASLSVVFECHAASRSIARAPRGPSDSFFSLSLSLSLLVIPCVRKDFRIKLGFAFPFFPGILTGSQASPDRLYHPVDFSSAFRDRALVVGDCCLPMHTHIPILAHAHPYRGTQGALFPRRTAPFFERDSSPISFRSSVIN